MKAKMTRGIAQIGCACLLALVNDGCSRSSSTGEPLSVDAVIEHPEKFTGAIAVAGTVAKTDAANGVFALGCEDACVVLPVKFSGNLPASERAVVVRGQIRPTAQGNYVFVAQTVEEK